MRFMETENRMVVPRGCGLGTMESYYLIDAEFQFWKMKSSERRMVLMVAQHNECT